MRWGFAVSATAHIGQSEATGQIDHPCVLIDCRALDRSDLVLAKGLAHNVEPTRERRIPEAPRRLTWPAGRDDRSQ
jgi:hypothetical protein